MGLLKNITGRLSRRNAEHLQKQQNSQAEANGIRRDDVDIRDRSQREHYVQACLEQMAEASKELETLGGEYNLVTSYLTDMEEIDAMPEDVKQQVETYAKQITELEQNQKAKGTRKSVMSEAEYTHMERIAQYMPAGYKKLKEVEEYQTVIKRDLGRLDDERQSYHYRRTELLTGQTTMKGITVICLGSMVLLMLILFVLQTAMGLDVQIGYLIAVLIAAVALTLVYVKFGESQKELLRVEKAINKLVMLQNTVKIRYVNNTNLLEYLYVKYDVNNSKDLKKFWEQYEEERKHREEEAQLRQEMEFSQAAMVKLLRKCKIQDPNVWIHQAEALYNSKEMVEIRHGLIIRRQKLRKQMEYNAKIAQDAQDEVKDMVQKYPEYAQKILDMVSEYEEALA